MAIKKNEKTILQAMLAFNALCALFALYRLIFDNTGGLMYGIVLLITGVAALGCWYQLRAIKAAERGEYGPLSE